MRRQENKAGFRVGLILLAACMAGAVTTRAAARPGQSGDRSDVDVKNSELQKQKNSKDRSSKVTNDKEKQAKAKATPEAKAAAKSAEEIAQLKRQLILQQKQIEQLLHAVNKLQAEVSTTAKPAGESVSPVTTSARPATVASTSRSALQYPGAGEVASLSPVLPVAPATAKSGPKSKISPVTHPTTSSAPRPMPVQGGKHEKLGPLAFQKIKLGVTFYGDWSIYSNTGFGPQFITQINQPGPGNGGFNSFDVTRAYLNFFYTPIDAVTLRITPNIYRQVATGTGGQANGIGASFGSSANGSLAFRLKYAYVDFNHPFKGSKLFGKDKITIGQTTNPLVDWEEALWGYRYTSLVPWNYLSLSSTYGGAKVHGPIMFNGKEYLDYDIGVFNTASFHSLELTDKKQVMGRLTWYPMGTKRDRTSFGLTVFEDYGYNTKTPDTHSTPGYRFGALAHYQTHDKGYLIAGEFDLGRNVFSTGNMFSGVGPVAGGPYGDLHTLASAILAGDRTFQRGFDFFGHARLGGKESPWALFGMYQYFEPNTHVSNNPLNFERVLGGISYKFNKHLDFAFDSQNLLYTHSQFTFPANELSGITTPIPNAVTDNTNALFVNMQFNY